MKTAKLTYLEEKHSDLKSFILTEKNKYPSDAPQKTFERRKRRTHRHTHTFCKTNKLALNAAMEGTLIRS